ncbi:MAG: hypothetical protein GWM98_05720, partial [Nitrospinaceae bacterium]|nr:hypothetical protein [Nitrospinaceae bacterium]NIR54058.1 hypothetical protein [Nitrospinaceae bacterium]NIS84475.1 hypothetical protein [Nitrospinaceae bacterium]NIT81271.1 hypothetical protein [Nitrospinaceae bacterium]NIU43558.1 hypothetical protein [Nitrospinaceae bacterium]
MTPKTLNLKAVDELIRRHSEVSGWETRRLLEIIRGHFKTESDLESLGHIPPEDIKARLQETQPPIPGDRFKSLKIALNEELRTLALQEHKPVLLINEENVFVQEEGVESESPGSPPPGSSPESPASR